MDANEATFSFEPIRLKDGWSGRVLTEWRLPEGVIAASSAVLEPDDWRDNLATLLNGPESLPGFRILKHSRNSNVVAARFSLRGQSLDVVCKHRIARGAMARTVDKLRGSQLALSWSRAFGVLRAGISTALPRVLIERHSPAAEAWMISEAVPDAIDLDGIFGWQIHSSPPEFRPVLKRALVRELASLCSKMDRYRVFHRDFKASNVLVTDWEGATPSPTLWLIDLDGVRVPARVRSIRRSIIRLAASLADQPSMTRADCCRFLKAFVGHDRGARSGWKEWWRQVAPYVERYNRLAKRRKVGKLDGFEG